MKFADLKKNELFTTTDFTRFGTPVKDAPGTFRFTVFGEDRTMSFKAAMPTLPVGAVKLAYRDELIGGDQIQFLTLVDSVNTVAEAEAKVALKDTLASITF